MEFLDVELRAMKPYPQIENATDDAQTVAVLKDLANGRDGELNGILTYIFQSTIADKTNADIGEIFEEIAIVEMRHLGLLMHAICSFGGTPKYEISSGAPFNIGGVNYSLKLKDMLEANIRGEQAAIANYTQAIKMVKNESLKELFERIILDEQKHVDALKQIRAQVQFLSV